MQRAVLGVQMPVDRRPRRLMVVDLGSEAIERQRAKRARNAAKERGGCSELAQNTIRSHWGELWSKARCVGAICDVLGAGRRRRRPGASWKRTDSAERLQECPMRFWMLWLNGWAVWDVWGMDRMQNARGFATSNYRPQRRRGSAETRWMGLIWSKEWCRSAGALQGAV